VKINPEAWSDSKVREDTIAWCRTFRTIHAAFLACVLIAALLDENDFSPSWEAIDLHFQFFNGYKLVASDAGNIFSR
jgi:hypothetical protein